MKSGRLFKTRGLATLNPWQKNPRRKNRAIIPSYFFAGMFLPWNCKKLRSARHLAKVLRGIHVPLVL
jgi:hypothetical protein